MMAIRKHNTKITLRDFDMIDDKLYYRFGNHELVFHEIGGAYAKKFIEVWYLENTKRYLKEQKIIDNRPVKNKWLIQERNRKITEYINQLFEDYQNEQFNF